MIGRYAISSHIRRVTGELISPTDHRGVNQGCGLKLHGENFTAPG